MKLENLNKESVRNIWKLQFNYFFIIFIFLLRIILKLENDVLKYNFKRQTIIINY